MAVCAAVCLFPVVGRLASLQDRSQVSALGISDKCSRHHNWVSTVAVCTADHPARRHTAIDRAQSHWRTLSGFSILIAGVLRFASISLCVGIEAEVEAATGR